ncbi:hypothetical protein BST81_04615 [Leptolyngbya sp. 'hensonii']|uniref:hypothetical protein n=1 Tax=Leptolyngbya sp. 'hensonii' TaxID=1922337 RepID=UPI00095022E6|nr:hypothetical protein [Leptolyngbya sp. 'hensonii']OLP19558.1 hypothetical protein BST81_04615 [Leptolyngbya sp. 'hensonii']
MTELPPTAAFAMLMNESSHLAGMAEQELPALLEPSAIATINRTILKLADQPGLHSFEAIPQIAEPVVEAMQGLVRIVERLRSPAGGWPSHLELTPENLAPYVTEELYELLHCLESGLFSETLPEQITVARSVVGRYWSMEQMIPRLLWLVARSSYSTMLLMGGVRARCYRPDGEWQPGMLRLASILEVEAPRIRWHLDLATNQAPLVGLPADTLLQADDGNFCKQPTQAGVLLQQLTEQIQSATPEANMFTDGATADLLEPGKTWQSAWVRLRVALIFMADVAVSSIEADADQDPTNQTLFLESAFGLGASVENLDTLPETIGDLFADQPSPSAPSGSDAWQETTPSPDSLPDTITDLFPQADTLPEEFSPAGPAPLDPVARVAPLEDATPQAAIGAAIVRLADGTIGEHTLKTVIRQKLKALAPQLAALPPASEVEDLPDGVQKLTLPLVQAAFEVASALQDPADSLEPDLLQPEILMDEWVPKLLWYLTGSSYEVMQLIGGVRARVLQPEQGWEAGILRLLVVLKIATAGQEWNLDLGAGYWLTGQTAILEADVVVQSNESDLCQVPEQLGTLLTQLTQQIQMIAPVIRILMGGVAADFLEAGDWQSGSMQLSLQFSLLPNVGFTGQ